MTYVDGTAWLQKSKSLDTIGAQPNIRTSARMLSVVQGLDIIAQHLKLLGPERTLLSPAALGQMLAEDIASDIDVPPYDKAMMDGYAVRSQDLSAGEAILE